MGKVVVSHIAVARPDRATPEELGEILRAIVKEGLVGMPGTLLIGNVGLQSPGFLDPDAPPAGTTVAWRGEDLDDLLDALGHAWLTHDVMVLFRTWSPTTLAEVGFALVSLKKPREITLFTASEPRAPEARTWDDSETGPEDDDDLLPPSDDDEEGAEEEEPDPEIETVNPYLPPTQTAQMGADGNELIFGEGSVGPFHDYVVIEGRDAPRIWDLDCTDITDIMSMACHSRLTLCQSEW